MTSSPALASPLPVPPRHHRDLSHYYLPRLQRWGASDVCNLLMRDEHRGDMDDLGAITPSAGRAGGFEADATRLFATPPVVDALAGYLARASRAVMATHDSGGGVSHPTTTQSSDDIILTLDLRNTNMDDQDCVALASALRRNASLTELDVSDNRAISAVGIEAIVQGIKSHPRLAILRLWTPPSAMREAGEGSSPNATNSILRPITNSNASSSSYVGRTAGPADDAVRPLAFPLPVATQRWLETMAAARSTPVVPPAALRGNGMYMAGRLCDTMLRSVLHSDDHLLPTPSRHVGGATATEEGEGGAGDAEGKGDDDGVFVPSWGRFMALLSPPPPRSPPPSSSDDVHRSSTAQDGDAGSDSAPLVTMPDCDESMIILFRCLTNVVVESPHDALLHVSVPPPPPLFSSVPATEVRRILGFSSDEDAEELKRYLSTPPPNNAEEGAADDDDQPAAALRRSSKDASSGGDGVPDLAPERRSVSAATTRRPATYLMLDDPRLLLGRRLQAATLALRLSHQWRCLALWCHHLRLPVPWKRELLQLAGWTSYDGTTTTTAGGVELAPRIMSWVMVQPPGGADDPRSLPAHSQYHRFRFFDAAALVAAAATALPRLSPSLLPASSNGGTVTRLHVDHFGAVGFGDEGAITLAAALRSCSTLVEVSLKGNGITNRGSAALCSALRLDRSSGAALDDSKGLSFRLGDVPMPLAAAGLHLRELNLSGNDIGDAGAKMWFDLFASHRKRVAVTGWLAPPPQLASSQHETSAASSTTTSAAGGFTVLSTTTLTALFVDGNPISPVLAADLQRIMLLNTQPDDFRSQLDGAIANVRDVSRIVFVGSSAASAASLSAGQEGVLSRSAWRPVGDVGCRVLLQSLRVNTFVRHIDLSYNGITDEGAALLAHIVAQTTTSVAAAATTTIGGEASSSSSLALTASSAKDGVAGGGAGQYMIRRVILKGNHIGNHGALCLLAAMAENPECEEIDLTEQRDAEGIDATILKHIDWVGRCRQTPMNATGSAFLPPHPMQLKRRARAIVGNDPRLSSLWFSGPDDEDGPGSSGAAAGSANSSSRDLLRANNTSVSPSASQTIAATTGGANRSSASFSAAAGSLLTRKRSCFGDCTLQLVLEMLRVNTVVNDLALTDLFDQKTKIKRQMREGLRLEALMSAASATTTTASTQRAGGRPMASVDATLSGGEANSSCFVSPLSTHSQSVINFRSGLPLLLRHPVCMNLLRLDLSWNGLLGEVVSPFVVDLLFGNLRSGSAVASSASAVTHRFKSSCPSAESGSSRAAAITAADPAPLLDPIAMFDANLGIDASHDKSPTASSSPWPLQELILDGNLFRASDIADWALIVQNANHVIQRISLEDNPRLVPADLTVMANACALNRHGMAFKRIVVRAEANDPTLTAVNLVQLERICDPGTSHRFAKKYDDEAVALLCAALTRNTNVVGVSLAGHNVTDAGAAHLAELLASNVTVTQLNVEANDLSDVGVEKLTRAVIAGGRVVVLAASGNRRVATSTLKKLNAAVALNVQRMSGGTTADDEGGDNKGGFRRSTGASPALYSSVLCRKREQLARAAEDDALIEDAIGADAMAGYFQTVKQNRQQQRGQPQPPAAL